MLFQVSVAVDAVAVNHIQHPVYHLAHDIDIEVRGGYACSYRSRIKGTNLSQVGK